MALLGGACQHNDRHVDIQWAMCSSVVNRRISLMACGRRLWTRFQWPCIYAFGISIALILTRDLYA